MFVHQIEADDTLSWVNEAWLQFARDNQAPHLTLETVLGRPLWDFIHEATIRQFYQIIVRRVRMAARAITLPYRCDSPDKRRFMRMEIHPLGGGRIQFRNWILREEVRPALELLAARAPDPSRLVVMCSWCKRVRNDLTAQWQEPEVAVAQMRLFNCAIPPRITHGVCPECSKVLEEEIERIG
ncbi:MAG: hypothetical protein N3J91_10220 [Verrucomicrobiae bacterium]|nr:hypothetical protein [Verrucomicrobiae bacterium]